MYRAGLPEGQCDVCGIFVEVLGAEQPETAPAAALPELIRSEVLIASAGELQKLCRGLGLKASGTKTDLITRLLRYMDRHGIDLGPEESDEWGRDRPGPEDPTRAIQRRQVLLFTLGLGVSRKAAESISRFFGSLDELLGSSPDEVDLLGGISAADASRVKEAIGQPNPLRPPVVEPKPEDVPEPAIARAPPQRPEPVMRRLATPPPAPEPTTVRPTPPPSRTVQRQLASERPVVLPPPPIPRPPEERPLPPPPPPELGPQVAPVPAPPLSAPVVAAASDEQSEDLPSEPPATRLRRDRILFYLGVLVASIGGPGLTVGSLIHDALRVPLVGQAYDAFGPLNVAAGVGGAGLLAVGIGLIIVALRGGLLHRRVPRGARS